MLLSWHCGQLGSIEEQLLVPGHGIWHLQHPQQHYRCNSFRPELLILGQATLLQSRTPSVHEPLAVLQIPRMAGRNAAQSKLLLIEGSDLAI
jgi:hypothetical protein